MSIDIFSIKPSVVSRDLNGKSFFIYGEKKSGKTSNAVKFPSPILLAFEKGYGLISGIKAQPINKWTEALTVKKQLLKDAQDVAEGKKDSTVFKTVIVDTADLAYNFCEEFILQREGKSYLSETDDKRGYKEVEKEYEKFFQDVCRAGYALVVISHSTTVTLKDEKGEKYERIQPTVDKRGLKVLSRMVDVMGYAAAKTDEEGNTKMVLHLRGNTYLEAGSRNPYMSEKIPFTYDALRDDMVKAIDKLEENGATVVDESENNFYQAQTVTPDFKSCVKEIGGFANKLKKIASDDGYNMYKDIVSRYLDKNALVSKCTEDQADILGLILSDLKDIDLEELKRKYHGEESEED